MNKRILGFVLALVSASQLIAVAQEPPGCAPHSTKKKPRAQISGKLAKGDVLDLRSKKRSAKHAAATRKAADDPMQSPVIASPIFLSQPANSGTAITASNGFLFVVVGQKLYKVNEKSLKTVQVSELGVASRLALDSEAPKKHHKTVASTHIKPKTSEKHRGTKTR